MDNNQQPQQPYGQQPQQPYGQGPQPPYVQGPMQPQNNNLAIAALVMGIISLVFCWAGYFAIVPLIAGIVGIVLAVKAQKEIPIGAPGRGMAVAGLVMSIVGAVLSAIFFTCTVVAVCTFSGYVNDLNGLFR